MIKVCMVQQGSVKYDKVKNLDKAEQIIKEASEKKTDVILFPEMYTTGYTVFDKLDELEEDMNGYSVKRFQELAKQYNIMIIFGFVEKNPKGKPFNSSCIIDKDGTIVGTYAKTHGWAQEEETFTLGNELKTFETSIGKIGLLICYDIEFPEPARLLALQGTKMIFMLAQNMKPDEDLHIEYMKARALENCVFTFSANGVGDDGTYEYCGRSVAVSPYGEYLAQGSMEKEEILYAEFDPKDAYKEDESLNYIARRRTDLYENLTK